MRINDLSTFDSKPILLSQFAELLNSNNITMQGNQVNVPSGLVLLDDKGKIPEDADIQRIFYIDGEFPTENLVKNALYVSSSGEARATGENAEYINISLQVVSDFSTVSDDTVATTKAIKDYVDAAVTGVATGTSGVLSSYATKEYVDSAVASASGEQHIFYVDSLPAVADAVENSLYVIKSTKEAQIFDGTEYAPISLETLNDFSTVSNDTLATTQAISAFVDEKISNINIPDPDLSAYQPVSSMTDYAKKTDIPNISGKVDNVGTNQSINDNATFTINATTSFDVNAPFSSFAGGKVVCYDGLGVTGDITLNGNTFNISGGLVVVGDDGKIPETLYNSGSFNGFTAEDISGSVISETVKTIKAGENIEFSEQDGVLTIKGTGLEYREDISFTADSLNDGKLTVSECSIGSCCVMDNNGNLVMPDQQQSGSDVILNLSGYTITGTWKVKFIQGRIGGVTPEYAQQMATTYAIIFGS